MFSDYDINAANKYNIVNYVATPIGILRKYNATTQKHSIISHDIPWDKNHPGTKYRQEENYE